MSKLAAAVSMLVVSFGLLWVRALVILAFVGWFVAPVWPVPPIPVAAAMGLQLLFQSARHNSESRRDETRSEWRQLAEGIIESLVTSGVLWVMGYVVARFGGLS